MTEIPVISFSYLTPMQLDKLRDLMVMKPYVLKCITSKYALVRNTDNPMVCQYSTVDLLYDDIFKYPDGHPVRNTYRQLVEEYGHEIVDIFLTRDGNSIKQKIVDTVNMALNRVYKTDELEIQFNKYNIVNGEKCTSSFPELLYEAAQENYALLEQQLYQQKNIIIIGKRR